jgi:hypothetical protein
MAYNRLMNSEWVDNIEVSDLIFLGSYEKTYRLAFHYRGFLITIYDLDEYSLTVYETYFENSILCFRDIYDFNYYRCETNPPFIKFIDNFKRMKKNLTIDYQKKEEIVNRFKVQRRIYLINSIKS